MCSSCMFVRGGPKLQVFFLANTVPCLGVLRWTCSRRSGRSRTAASSSFKDNVKTSSCAAVGLVVAAQEPERPFGAGAGAWAKPMTRAKLANSSGVSVALPSLWTVTPVGSGAESASPPKLGSIVAFVHTLSHARASHCKE